MNSGQVDGVTSSPALPDLVFLRLLATSELGGQMLASVTYCYHVYVRVCMYLLYVEAFIGNLTVVLMVHVLPCGGIWAVLVGFQGRLCFNGRWAGPPFFLYDLVRGVLRFIRLHS